MGGVRFRVRHDTRYGYDVPVTLGAHALRILPRLIGVRLEYQSVRILPEPAWRREEVDVFGNRTLHVGFVGSTHSLSIESELVAHTEAPDALSDASWQSLPWGVGSSDDPPMEYASSRSVHPTVCAYAHGIAAEVAYRPLAFLDRLSRSLFQSIDRGIRFEGAAQEAHETLAIGKGACRDVTVLFLDCARVLGIPARFVSGYQATADTPDGTRYLHAWAEVHLPRVGWRGWDAMHGLRVRDGHLALFAASAQAGTMPVDGGYAFQGAVLNSTLDYSVRIETGEGLA